jgi:alpha-tubulin suppressor-like RCC1 family protein
LGSSGIAGSLVYTWGCGYHGALGHGDENHCVVPTVVNAFMDCDDEVVEVCGGQSHSVALTRDGSVYAWGDIVGCKIPQKVKMSGTEHDISHVASGKKFFAASCQNVVTRFPCMTTIITATAAIQALACSNEACIAADEESALYIFGEALDDSTSLISHDPAKRLDTGGVRVGSISCGERHCIVTDAVSGSFWSFGRDNWAGKLGTGGDGGDRIERSGVLTSVAGGLRGSMAAGGSNHSLFAAVV